MYNKSTTEGAKAVTSVLAFIWFGIFSLTSVVFPSLAASSCALLACVGVIAVAIPGVELVKDDFFYGAYPLLKPLIKYDEVGFAKLYVKVAGKAAHPDALKVILNEGERGVICALLTSTIEEAVTEGAFLENHEAIQRIKEVISTSPQQAKLIYEIIQTYFKSVYREEGSLKHLLKFLPQPQAAYELKVKALEAPKAAEAQIANKEQPSIPIGDYSEHELEIVTSPITIGNQAEITKGFEVDHA
jgi:hypothetical protein